MFGGWRPLSMIFAAAGLVSSSSSAIGAELAEIAIVHNSLDRDFPMPSCKTCPKIDASGPISLPGKIRAVVATGHSEHGRYLGLFTEDFVWLLQSLAPELEWLVLDTCLGADADLLLALDAAGLRVQVVVAAAFTIPAQGLSYGRLFEQPRIGSEDLEAISCCGSFPQPLTKIRDGAGRIIREMVASSIAAARRCGLEKPLVQKLPNLYPAEAPINFRLIDGPILVDIPSELWPENCEST
jgi:hypothetical protein